MVLVDVVFVIEAMDMSVVVAIAAPVGVDAVDSAVATNLVDAVVAVDVTVALCLHSGCWCSLSCICRSSHRYFLSRMQSYAPF